MFIRIVKGVSFSFLIAMVLVGCTTTQKITSSTRTTTEQLLISEALKRSLPKQANAPLPIPQGSVVKLDVVGLTGDKDLVKGAVAGWLGQHGYIAQDEPAAYRMNIMVDSIGTEQANTFFGIPPITAALIPISLPKLAFYEADYQTGYSRFHLDIFEVPSGRFVGSTSSFIGDTHYNAHTILFLFKLKRTDLTSPPEVGSFMGH